MPQPAPLVLASVSSVQRKLLADAGVTFVADPGDQVGALDDGTPLEKPLHAEHQVRMLGRMGGRSHTFHPAAALVRGDEPLAETATAVTVTFRSFAEETARAPAGGRSESARQGSWMAHCLGARAARRQECLPCRTPPHAQESTSSRSAGIDRRISSSSPRVPW